MTTLELLGETRKWALPQHKASYKHWYYTYVDTENFQKSLNVLKLENIEKLLTRDSSLNRAAVVDILKKRLPKMALLGYNFSLICGDFDSLPSRFTSFSEFRSYLKSNYPGAIVTSSARDMAKIFFVINDSATVNSSQAILILKELLNNDSLFNIADKSESAYTQSFFTASMFNEFNQQSQTCGVFNYTFQEKKEREGSISCSTVRSYPQYQGLVPKDLYSNFINPTSLRGGHDSKKKEELVRTLLAPLARQKLLTGQYSIPVVSLGLSLNKSKSWVSKQLSILKSLEWLVTNGSYRTGMQAKQYEANGLLRLEIDKLNMLEPVLVKQIPPPTVIKDNQWHKAIRQAVNYFQGNETLVNEWFYSCAGWDEKKDRETQKDRWIASYKGKKKERGSISCSTVS